MAGNYPDMPASRLAYDRDGSRVYRVVSGVATEQSDAVRQALNSESDTGAGVGVSTNVSVAWIFNRRMDITFGWLQMTGGIGVTVDVSNDTTDGSDGSWSSARGAFTAETLSPNTAWRTETFPLTASNVQALRVRRLSGSANLSKLFLFGEAAAADDRLEFWDPTSDVVASANLLEWGDRPRNSSQTRTFRVKNMSSLYTATDVRVAQEALYDTSPSVPGQHQISKDDGATWGAQQTIGDLTPGAISTVVLQIKQTLDPAATPSLWAHRLFTEALTWEV